MHMVGLSSQSWGCLFYFSWVSSCSLAVAPNSPTPQRAIVYLSVTGRGRREGCHPAPSGATPELKLEQGGNSHCRG